MLYTILLVALVSVAQESRPAIQSVPVTDLAEALERGLVTVSLSGSGGSSGDVVTMKIKRIANTPLRLRLRRGTVLKSLSGAVQNMIVAKIKGEQAGDDGYYPSEVVELPDDKERVYLLEAYCLDFEKDNPGATDRFLISTVDGSALALIQALPEAQRSLGAVQASLWLAAGVAKSEISKRFPVSTAEMAAAERAVVAARKR